MSIGTIPTRYGSDATWLEDKMTDFWREAQEEAGDNEPFECSDNFRLACKQDAVEMLEYEQAQNEGCCGAIDVEFGPSPSGKTYVYGFNYGH